MLCLAVLNGVTGLWMTGLRMTRLRILGDGHIG